MNPFTFGDYPDIMKKNAGPRLPSFTQKESNLVKGSIDFIGLNFYYSFYVRNNPSSLPMQDRDYLADAAAVTESMSYAVSVTYFLLHNQLYIEVQQVTYIEMFLHCRSSSP